MTDKTIEVRVLSIDPGFTNLGATFSIMNLSKGIQHQIQTQTFNIPKHLKAYNTHQYANASKHVIECQAVKDIVGNLLKQHEPDIVVCEKTYMGRFPNAFASLTLCINAIETACFDYDSDMYFITFEPSVIKKANGVSGNSSNKDDITKALLANKNIIPCEDITLFDEHSADSVAIGFCYLKFSGNIN